MKKSVSVYLFFITSFLFAQDSIPSNKFETLKTNYRDFVISNNKIFAISKGDSLVEWDIKINNPKILNKKTKVVAKNSRDEVLLGLENGDT